MDDPEGGGSDRELTGTSATIGLAANVTAIVVGAFTVISLVTSIATIALQNWPMVMIASGSMILLATILYRQVAGVTTPVQKRMMAGVLVAGFVLVILGGASLGPQTKEPLAAQPQPPSNPPTPTLWQGPRSPDPTYHCGAYTKVATVRFQECVIVYPTPEGAYVQSLLAVDNPSSTAQTVDGDTYLYLGPNRLNGSVCGTTVVAARGRQWCFSLTTLVPGHGRDVQGQGYLSGGGFGGAAFSPTVKT